MPVSTTMPKPIVSANLGALGDATQRILHGNFSTTKAGFAIHGSTKTSCLTAAAVTYAIGGVLRSLAAQTAIATGGLTYYDETGTATTIAVQATGTSAVYLFSVDAAGTIRVQQGAAQSSSSNVPCPGALPTLAPFGAVKVTNASGSNFTIGTTAFDAANVTSTFYDLAIVPQVL